MSVRTLTRHYAGEADFDPEHGRAAAWALGALIGGEVIAQGPKGEVFILVTVDRFTFDTVCAIDEHDGGEPEEDCCPAGDDNPQRRDGGSAAAVAASDDSEPSLGWGEVAVGGGSWPYGVHVRHADQRVLDCGNGADLEHSADDEGEQEAWSTYAPNSALFPAEAVS